jgi:hypothetical protein
MNETMGQVEKKPLLGLIANYLREETSTAIYHNPDKLRHVYASQAEKLIRNYFKGNIRSAGNSYDIDSPIGTIEVKATGGFVDNTSNRSSYKAVGNLHSKKNKCDFIAIVDFASQRVSVIPNIVFFKRAKLTKTAHKGSFTWAADYVPKRKGTRVENNTKLFKEYEIDSNKEFNKLGMGDKL